MRKEETEGIPGRQEDGSSKTREARAVSVYTAERQNPKTGEQQKDPGSDIRSGRIDSAAAGIGSSMTGFGKGADRGPRYLRVIHRHIAAGGDMRQREPGVDQGGF